MMLAERRGLPVALHTPTEVKAAVSGSGRADKAQVTTMVTRLLGLDHAPKPADAADALALAICHVWRGGTQGRLEEAHREALARGGTRPGGLPRRSATTRPARPTTGAQPR
jgi:crossover junction endodeoxyribonuclease RuvC